MSITWVVEGDARHDLGPNGILQKARASFGASDYVTGGYPVFPQNFGLSAIKGIWPIGFTATGAGTPGGYEWVPVEPAIGGPAATNSWFLKSMQTGAPPTETASNTNFNGGSMDVLAYGY